jgi:integrase
MAKMNMQGIDQLPSGSYRIRVQHKGEKITETAPTLGEAIATRDELKRNGRSGRFVKAGDATMRSWGPGWLRKYRKAKDYKPECSRFKQHILPYPIADIPLTHVTEDDVVVWCAKLEKQVIFGGHHCEDDPPYLSFSSRKHSLDLMRALFKDAKRPDERLCKVNPAHDVKLEKSLAEKRKQFISVDWPLREGEIIEHLGSFDVAAERDICGASLGTGMRQGEQWALRIPDVHLGGTEPYIFIREGKTLDSTRKIPLFGLGLESFQRWMEVLGKYAPRNPDRLVFPTPVKVKKNGELWGRGGNQRKEGAPPFFEKRRMVSTRTDGIWWHLYRHTCATSLLSGVALYGGQKWTMQEVSKLLGHTSTKTTEMYAHFLDSALAPVVSRTQQGWDQQPRRGGGNELRLVG